MRRCAILIWTVLAAAGCAKPPPVAVQDPNCPGYSVTVSFTSVCCGVDQEGVRRVEAILEHTSLYERVTRRPWGREGEFDLCITSETERDAEAIYRVLTIGGVTEQVGPPILIRGPGGKSYNSAEANKALAD